MTRVYVGSLSSEVTGSDLRGLFAAYGQVDSAQVVMDSTNGESRGFGFVELQNTSDLEGTIAQLHGLPLSGRALTINAATPKLPRGREVHAQHA